MPEFWEDSGFKLLNRDPNGHLSVTEDFLRAYFMRPEVRPVEESCDAERSLHQSLMDNPRLAVDEASLEGIADADARENYGVLLDFRDRLLKAGTMEACYRGLFEEGAVSIPALFIDQMVHVILRNILDGTAHPMRARAGELLFRQQTATIEDGAILLGDTDTVEMYAATGGKGDLGRLVAQAGTPVKTVELDVLTAENADIYWGRNQDHDIVLDLTFSRPGLDALCRVLESWVAHFLAAKVNIQPVRRITDERWLWHTGLDGESSRLLNDLYNGAEVDEERLARLLSLFRLEFEDPSLMRADIRGRPVYLGLAMSSDKKVRLKPQNLLTNLPLAAEA